MIARQVLHRKLPIKFRLGLQYRIRNQLTHNWLDLSTKPQK